MVIQDSVNGAKAYIDLIDGDKIFYHRNDNLNYLPWVVGRNIQDSAATFGPAEISADSQGEFDPFTG